jgi:hypothetical protein
VPRTRGAKKVRLNLEVAPQVRRRLESLKERKGAESLTEIIRTALQIYEELEDCKDRGAKLIIREPDGQEMLLRFV